MKRHLLASTAVARTDGSRDCLASPMRISVSASDEVVVRSFAAMGGRASGKTDMQRAWILAGYDRGSGDMTRVHPVSILVE